MFEEMGGNDDDDDDVATPVHRVRNMNDSEEEGDTDAEIIAGMDYVASQDKTYPCKFSTVFFSLQ